MELVLFAPHHFALEQVARPLQEAGLTVNAQPVAVAMPLHLPAHFDAVVLIFPEQDLIGLSELTQHVRKLLGAAARLVLCAPQFIPSERRWLCEAGASAIITPRAWVAGAVVERILAEAILAGAVQPASCGSMRGATAVLQQLYQVIATLAPLNEPVLIVGETGTGKELVAKELHRQSRRPGELLPVNCPELNRELFASELFGHERGAFTNAVQARKGLLAAAGGGTVFLDEIGDLDGEAQVKLLRVLEERRVRRVGGNKWEPIEARIVLATNHDLAQDVDEGKFRADLFMRMQGLTITPPPLRARRADLLLLAHHFVAEYNGEYQTQLAIPDGALDCLFHYEWPGNVRELRAAVRKAAVFADPAARLISAALLQEAARPRQLRETKYTAAFDPTVDTLPAWLERAQQQYLRAILALEKGNKEAAAKRAGISRSQFYEKLKAADSKVP